MSQQPSSTGLRVFWVLLTIALGALAVASVVSIASGGYRPPVDPSGFDPVRIGMLVFLVGGTAAFALAMIGSILAWRADPEPFALGFLLLPVGLTVATAAMVPIVAILFAEPGHNSVPSFLRFPLYVGLGVLVLGILWSMVPALREGIRRRDPLPFLALVLLVGWVVLIRSRS